MELTDITSLVSLTPQQQLYLTWVMILFKWAAEGYSSVRAGGGLKRIIMSFWFGEQLPTVVAQDYKKELSTPPFPPNA